MDILELLKFLLYFGICKLICHFLDISTRSCNAPKLILVLVLVFIIVLTQLGLTSNLSSTIIACNTLKASIHVKIRISFCGSIGISRNITLVLAVVFSILSK